MTRDFLLLLQGQFISRLGTQVALTATVFWLKESTGSATILSLLLAICAIPPVVLGPFGGACADRYSRRSILIYCDLLCGLASVILAFIVWALPTGAAAVIASIFLVNFLLACGQAFFMPAVIAAVPDLLPQERVASGMSLAQALGLVANVAGQAVGGLLLVFGAPVLFLLDGASYLLTAAAESQIRLPHRERTSTEATGFRRFWNDTTSGFEYVWSRPPMRMLLLSAIPLNMLLTPVFVLLPFYTTDVLHRGPAWYGYLMAAFSGGTMGGYVVAGLVKIPAAVLRLCFCSGVLLTGILLASLGWLTSAVGAWMVLFGLGALTGWVSLTAITMLQAATEEGARGRVFGVLLTVSQGMTPLAMLLAGLIAEVTGNNLRLIYTVCGAGAFAVAARLSFNQQIREFFSLSAQ